MSGRVNTALLIANAVAFLLQTTVLGPAVVDRLMLWPLGEYRDPYTGGTVGFQVWQLVTSAFLHGNVVHLLLNLYPLWMFGREIERALGSRRYLALYAASILTASLTQLAWVTINGTVVPTLGASGGVFGVLLAFGMLFPNRQVILLIPPIPLPARVFVLLYGGLELFHGVTNTAQGVAHFAHLGGMLGAWIVLATWRARARRARGL